jgi:hypothetical protein
MEERFVVGDEFGEQYKGTYVLKPLAWAKHARISQRHTRIDYQTGRILEVDYITSQLETVMASLHGQPEKAKITFERLSSEDAEVAVPSGLVEKLLAASNKLNGMDFESNSFLPIALGENSDTQQSQSSGSSKKPVGPLKSSIDRMRDELPVSC